MAIVVKKKTIEENLVDEKGNILGKISYNPDDPKSYSKLMDIISRIQNISSNVHNLSKLGDIKTDKITVDNIDDYADLFKTTGEDMHVICETIKSIKEDVNSVFGAGTSEIMMGEGLDIDLLTPLIDNVMPNFKKGREEKVNSYLDDAEDVM